MLKQNINARKNLFRYILTFAAAGIFCFAFVCCNGGNDDGFAPNISKDQKAIVEKLLKLKSKTSGEIFCDLSGKPIGSDIANYYLENGLKATNNELTAEAKNANVKSAMVTVRTVIGPDGKFLYAKAINGKINNRTMKADEYGLMTSSEQIILKSCLKVLVGNADKDKSNLQLGYNCKDIWIYFGDYNFYTSQFESIEVHSTDPKKTEKFQNLFLDNNNLRLIQEKIDSDKAIKKAELSIMENLTKEKFYMVKVTFYVNPELEIFNPKIENGINPEFDNAYLNVLKEISNSHILVKGNKPSGKTYDSSYCVKVVWKEKKVYEPTKK